MSHLKRSTADELPVAGFTLIEGLVTSSVLLLGLLAMTTTSSVVSTLRKEAVELELAESAMETLVEALEASAAAPGAAAAPDPAEVQDSIDTASPDWAEGLVRRYGWHGTTGPSVEVAGLEPWEDRATVATIQLVTDETMTDEELGAAVGMPRDLDGDGKASREDVTADAVMLPAVVSVRWLNGSGQHELTRVVYLLRP